MLSTNLSFKPMLFLLPKRKKNQKKMSSDSIIIDFTSAKLCRMLSGAKPKVLLGRKIEIRMRREKEKENNHEVVMLCSEIYSKH